MANWIVPVAHPKVRIVLAVILNIGLLAIIKYQAFLLGQDGGDSVAYFETVLPLGISFYTFQLLAFQIDSARGAVDNDPRTISFPLFIVFFPQLIAGPIVRAHQMMPQIRRLETGQRRRVRLVSFGLALCCLGLVKKIVLADSIAPLVDDIFFDVPASSFAAWVGAWLFAFQIYFDFSGYSDIAIGCAYLLGFRLPLNFRTPYLSLGPQEFWGRWHITLSTWIRDYVYIPLGGNAGGLARQTAVVVFVMAVAGLWHGANWTFVLWGALWGAYIAADRMMRRLWGGASNSAGDRALGPLHAVARWTPHMALVTLLWVFFRAPNLDFALAYIGVMFGRGDGGGLWAEWPLILAGCAALMALHICEARYFGRAALPWLRAMDGPLLWGVLTGLCLWLVLLPNYGGSPFIYFRF